MRRWSTSWPNALYREAGYPIASGATESAHRYVLQVRVKRAGQHWSMVNARKLAMPRRVLRLSAHPASSAW